MADKTPIVTLGGTTLGGASSYAWALRYGSGPNEALWTVSAERAAVIPLCSPLTFEVKSARKSLKVDQLYVLEVLPGPIPQQRTLRVVDRRWLWGRILVDSFYNHVRVTGTNILRSEGSAPVELTQLDPAVKHAKWSLDGEGIPWTALRLLDDLMKKLGTPYRIAEALSPIEVQDLELAGSGAECLDRLLAYIPGTEVYIDYDGTAVFRNVLGVPPSTDGTRTRGKPDPVLPALARRHEEGGDLIRVDRKALRPSAVEVYFQPEVEVRFNYPGESATQTRDAPELRNVCATPDLSTTLPTSEVVGRGTYVPLETLFSIWGAFGARNEALSFTALRAMGFASNMMEHLWGSSGPSSLSATPVNVARVSAAIDAWRKVYQIDETFVQRCAAIKAVRVAILNPRTGLRAKSAVYCPWTRRPNYRNPGVKGFIEKVDYGWAVNGYGENLSDAVQAPAEVVVLNESAGIIQIVPKLDQRGLADQIVLGLPAGGQLPTHDGDAQANLTGNDAIAQWAKLRVSDVFKLAVVLTVTPASPNDLGRLWKITVPASDVGATGTGPVVQIRAHMPTARFAWNDQQGEQIKLAIRTGGAMPAELLVNGPQLAEVAKAHARAVYANLSDQPVTSAPVSIDLDPDVKPVGVLGHVSHGLHAGRTTTLVSATGVRRPVDLWPFLDGATRRVLRQTFNQGAM